MTAWYHGSAATLAAGAMILPACEQPDPGRTEAQAGTASHLLKRAAYDCSRVYVSRCRYTALSFAAPDASPPGTLCRVRPLGEIRPDLEDPLGPSATCARALVLGVEHATTAEIATTWRLWAATLLRRDVEGAVESGVEWVSAEVLRLRCGYLGPARLDAAVRDLVEAGDLVAVRSGPELVAVKLSTLGLATYQVALAARERLMAEDRTRR